MLGRKEVQYACAFFALVLTSFALGSWTQTKLARDTAIPDIEFEISAPDMRVDLLNRGNGAARIVSIGYQNGICEGFRAINEGQWYSARDRLVNSFALKFVDHFQRALNIEFDFIPSFIVPGLTIGSVVPEKSEQVALGSSKETAERVDTIGISKMGVARWQDAKLEFANKMRSTDLRVEYCTLSGITCHRTRTRFCFPTGRE